MSTIAAGGTHHAIARPFAAQSAPPVEFVPAAKGIYQIEVRELLGKQRGTATLQVG